MSSSLLNSAWAKPCFPSLPELIWSQPKVLLISPPNSHTQVFASVTVGAAALLVPQYLAAAPSRKGLLLQSASFLHCWCSPVVLRFSTMTSIDGRCDHSSYQLPLQWRLWTWTTQISCPHPPLRCTRSLCSSFRLVGLMGEGHTLAGELYKSCIDMEGVSTRLCLRMIPPPRTNLFPQRGKHVTCHQDLATT